MDFEKMEYQRPDFEVFKERAMKDYQALKEAQSKKDFLVLFKKINSDWNETVAMYQLANIRYTINTKDPFYKQEQDYFDEMIPEYDAIHQQFYEIVVDCPWKEELKEEIPPQFFRRIENKLKLFNPSIIEDEKEENRLCSKYTSLIGSAKIEFDGQIYNLSKLSPLRSSKDRTIRKRANDAFWSFFEEHEKEFDEIYDGLVKVRDRMAKKLGFSNYVPVGYLGMDRIGYTKEDVASLRKKIIDFVVPFVQKQEALRKERLDLDTSHYYDNGIFYKEGNPTPKGEEEELIQKALEMYQEMGQSFKDTFEMMKENHLLNLTAKEGKTTGGYCQFIEKWNVPFIFANFNKTSHDVEVLTHEFGHSFQVYQSNKDNPMILEELAFPTNEAAEIFSISMEYLTHPYMESFFKEDTNRFLYKHLLDAISFLPYGALVDHFQEEVYLNPQMTPQERRALWRNLEKIYQPELDFSDMPYLDRGGKFVPQSHIYQNPFYYIDYALAYVAALEIWMLSLKDPEKAKEKYIHLAKIGGRKSYLELLEEGGLHNPFTSDILKEIMDTIERETDKIKIK